MARLRPKDSELITRLASFGKAYFTSADLERILKLSRPSVAVALHRLVKAGLLVRLRRNAYHVFTEPIDAEKAANELYAPAYLSFESALARWGILPQIPYTLRLATTRPSKRMTIGNTEVEFSHLKPDLFFGYILENGKNVATREKALLDQLYLVSRGKAVLNLEELDLREVDKDELEDYARKFPASLKPLLREVHRYLGTTPLTNETKERIRWKNN